VPEKLDSAITKLFQIRDELSFQNIRRELWPCLLIFPISVVMGNLRYYDHSIALAGFRSSELTLFVLGVGWLILTFTPKRLIMPFLRLAAVVSLLLLPFIIFMPVGFGWFTLYMAFKFFNGLCAACAFFMFCFVLNNTERLFGLALIQFYYGFYYAAWSVFPAFHVVSETWGAVFVAAGFLVIVFLCGKKQQEIKIDNDGKGSGVPFVIGLHIVFYMIVCMVNYIEWGENSLSAFAFGLGTFISIGIVIIVQLFIGRSALYLWLMFLVFSLLGLGALLYDTHVTLLSGSFAYGLGDGLGYIVICYMCAGAVKRSKSLRMFRLYCLMFFAEYFVISGLFSLCFSYFEAPNKFLAFGVVLVLVSISLLLMPFMQKRLFDADWTDGLYLRDMEEYSLPFAQTEAINAQNHLDLTPREEEIFTMLLSGKAPKEIAYTLKVSYYTVNFHQKNLYRKLGIQSRAELFAQYLPKIELHGGKNNRSTDIIKLNELNKQLICEIEKLETLAVTDELTKINNKRSFLEYMNLIWEHCRHLRLQINAVMIDVDNFKKYNDSLGHLEGDKALIAIAQCLKNQLKRETDFVARFGGEEFVCLLPFIDKDDAFAFAAALVQSVENLKIPHPKNEHSKYLTISAGIAHIIPDENNSSAQLLDLADKALYAAKKSGRNRVVVN